MPYDLWLNQIPGIGSSTILQLKAALGGSPDFARILYEMSPGERRDLVCRIPERGRGTGMAARITRLLNDPANPDPQILEEQLKQRGIRFLTMDDAEYPRRLFRIGDPPFGLYCLGRLPSDFRPSVGIVGTRMASPYGQDQARRFGRELASCGVQIISGMARGVDGIAGRGALDAGGESFAVLGCGVDICYPHENLDLYSALSERGGVLSEYPPGTQPQARLFPPRNRIISGLSDIVLVIEAKERSGTLITVDRALEYGIDVFALPGRVSDRGSAGCNQLIRQGAGIATCPEDILEYLFGEMPSEHWGLISGDAGNAGHPGAAMTVPASPESEDAVAPGVPRTAGQTDSRRGSAKSGCKSAQLSAAEQAVLDCLDDSTPTQIDALLEPVSKALSRRVSYRELVQTITLLSVSGQVQEVRVGNYIRVHSTL